MFTTPDYPLTNFFSLLRWPGRHHCAGYEVDGTPGTEAAAAWCCAGCTLALLLATWLTPAAQAPSLVATVAVGTSPHGGGQPDNAARVRGEYERRQRVGDRRQHQQSHRHYSSRQQPQNVAVNPSTNRVYVTNAFGFSVSEIDGATNTVITTADVGSVVDGIAVNPATNRVYVVDNGGGSVLVMDGRNLI
jgi:hypothetical protein